MKLKVVVLALLIKFNFINLYAQTLFTYGKYTVSKDEFLRAYNKNKQATDKEQSMQEYLTLYANFKLKVRAAKDLKLDTLPQLKSDIKNFRNQIEENYLTNTNLVNSLTNEAFNRSQKDIEVYHFFATIDEKTSTTDSIKSVNAMQELYNNLAKGNTDYDKLTQDISAKYVKITGANIGYFTVFSIPYEYENIIYDLKVGEASKPILLKKRVHIFKVLNERKDVGKWKIAQILLAIPPTADKKQIEQKADSIYLKLKNGADFSEMVKAYSNDKTTYQTGGVVPEFVTGRYLLDFENEVFKLKTDGEISKPFATAYGYHIVKRISVKPTPTSQTDAAYLAEIKQKVQQDARINIAKEAFSNAVIKQVNYKKIGTINDATLFKEADSVVNKPATYNLQKNTLSDKIIFTNVKSNIKGVEWLKFVKEYKSNKRVYHGETNAVLLNKFIASKSMEYYKNNLEDFNTDFRYQMDEFNDGNLLFEIMEQKVWNSAAATDINILNKYYVANKAKYTWNESADVLIFNCSNRSAATTALASLTNQKNWKKIVEESNNTVQVDSGRYELSQITLPNNFEIKEAKITPITINTTDSTARFIKIVTLHKANEQRSFADAKGLIINDYQNTIEDKWIAELKKKYPIKIDEKVFQSLER